jgi:hypothetical protein
VPRRLVLLLALAAASLTLPAAAIAKNPPIRHVWVVVLENKNYDETFGGHTGSPYLANTLTQRGLLAPFYYGVTHLSLGNYVAMVSGQGSNPQTQTDCQFYTPVLPGTIGADGQALGTGCVYPATVKTVADQLGARGRSWKAYLQDMKTPCRHPALLARDDTQSAEAGDQYAARHNPYVYFRSITDSPACAQHDVDLSALPGDLKHTATTASFSLVVPNLCEDGHDAPCVDKRPGGLKSADGWLKAWIPRITASPAYKKDGLIVITWDEAEATGANGDASACCGEPQFPNTANNGFTIPGRGGGRTGAVLLSPYIEPGTISTVPYNHFSLLRSVEDTFGLGHLGFAARPGLRTFGSDVYTCNPSRKAKLIRSVTVDRGVARRSTVEVRLNRRGVARVGARGRRIGRKRGVRCQPLRFRMPKGHGKALVRAGKQSKRVAY